MSWSMLIGIALLVVLAPFLFMLGQVVLVLLVEIISAIITVAMRERK